LLFFSGLFDFSAVCFGFGGFQFWRFLGVFLVFFSLFRGLFRAVFPPPKTAETPMNKGGKRKRQKERKAKRAAG